MKYVSKAHPSYIAYINPIKHSKYCDPVSIWSLSFSYHFLNDQFEAVKKDQQKLGEPELPAEPSSLALTFLLSRAKPSELQSPKAVTVGNVNKQTIEKIMLTTPRKKTEKHFKNVSDNTK